MKSSTLTLASSPIEPPLLMDSQQLFQGQRQLHIAHRGNIYQLRITRFNKLILTKPV